MASKVTSLPPSHPQAFRVLTFVSFWFSLARSSFCSPCLLRLLCPNLHLLTSTHIPFSLHFPLSLFIPLVVSSIFSLYSNPHSVPQSPSVTSTHFPFSLHFPVLFFSLSCFLHLLSIFQSHVCFPSFNRPRSLRSWPPPSCMLHFPVEESQCSPVLCVLLTLKVCYRSARRAWCIGARP